MTIMNMETEYQHPLSNNKRSSYVDIITNLDYEKIKVLDSISYILDNKPDNVLIDNFTKRLKPININNQYSGNKLLIYSDSTYSDIIDISHNVNNKINRLLTIPNKPYYNKGVWNFNYFRNIHNVNLEDNYSDNHSLIYGKYIVARFIFDRDKIKFSHLQFNLKYYE